MTTAEAARSIQNQLRSQGTPAPWSECLRWAADCRREAEARAEARRAAWFAKRREELRCEHWRQRVREAPIITEARHDGANGREGGWLAEYYKPEPKEEAA